MIAKLTLELPDDAARVRKARRVAACLLEGEPVTPEEAEDVDLVIGEICTNVVRHARSREGRYRVTLELFADRLGVTVEDRGRGSAPPDLPDARPAGTERQDPEFGQRFGGWGLPLAEALTDRLLFRPTDPERPAGERGTTVYAEKMFNALRGRRDGAEGRRDEQPEEPEGARGLPSPGGLLYDCVRGSLSVAVYECAGDGHPPGVAEVAATPDTAGAAGGTHAAGDACRFEIYVNGELASTAASQMEAEQEARRIAEQGIVHAAEEGRGRLGEGARGEQG
jgi:serine/threonine-protein kinase RsbW